MTNKLAIPIYIYIYIYRTNNNRGKVVARLWSTKTRRLHKDSTGMAEEEDTPRAKIFLSSNQYQKNNTKV